VYTDLIGDGFALMVVGMGTVFVFLTVAVVSVSLMSRLAKNLEARIPAPAAGPVDSKEAVPPEHIAAISAAVARYRASRSK